MDDQLSRSLLHHAFVWKTSKGLFSAKCSALGPVYCAYNWPHCWQTALQSARSELLFWRLWCSRRVTTTMLLCRKQARAHSPPIFEPWSSFKLQNDRILSGETALQSAKPESSFWWLWCSRGVTTTMLLCREQARACSPPIFEPWSSFKLQNDRVLSGETALQSAEPESLFWWLWCSRRVATTMLLCREQAKSSFSTNFWALELIQNGEWPHFIRWYSPVKRWAWIVVLIAVVLSTSRHHHAVVWRTSKSSFSTNFWALELIQNAEWPHFTRWISPAQRRAWIVVLIGWCCRQVATTML